MRKRLLSSVMLVLMTLALAMPVNAATPQQVTSGNLSESHFSKVNNAAANRLVQSINQNKMPKAEDLMLSMKAADSTKILLGDIDQEICDLVEDNISASGIMVLSEVPTTKSVQLQAPEHKEFTISVYQLAENGNLLTQEDALQVARARDLTYTYSNGNSTYQVYGSFRANFKFKPGTTTEITFSSVDAMTSWGTSACRTTKMRLAARVDVDFGADWDFNEWTFNNPDQSVWYTLFLNFGLYKTIGGSGSMPDSAYASCTYTMSNGQSFELWINVRNTDDFLPYEGWME